MLFLRIKKKFSPFLIKNYCSLFFRVFTNTICSEFGSLEGRTENSNKFCVMVTMTATKGQQRELHLDARIEILSA